MVKFVVSSGQVFNEAFASSVFAAADLPSGTHSMTIEAGGLVDVSNEHYAFFFENPNFASGEFAASASYTFTVKIAGTLIGSGVPDDSFGGGAMVFTNGATKKSNSVNVANTGLVQGEQIAIYAVAATDIDNAGKINGGGWGVEFNSQDDRSNISASKTLSVTNKFGAEITSSFLGISNYSLATLSVKNSGLITGGGREGWSADDPGDAIFSQSTSKLINSVTGIINGGVTSIWHSSSIDNKGIINGTVRSGIQEEQVVVDSTSGQTAANGMIDSNRDGTFDKHINAVNVAVMTVVNAKTIFGNPSYAKDNRDTVDTSDDFTFQVALDLSNGIDVVTNTLTGQIDGDVWMYGGHDRLTNSGVINGDIDVGLGGTRDGFTIIEDNDVVDNKGTINGRIWSGYGADKVTNAKSATISGDVQVGTDVLPDADQKGEDADTVENKGTIGGQILTGLGDDKVTSSGLVSYVDTSAWALGNNPLNAFDNDNDTITNSGNIAGVVRADDATEIDAVWMGHGKDSLTNSKTITGNVMLGVAWNTGDSKTAVIWADYEANDTDTVINTKSAKIDGNVFTGVGKDTVDNKGTITKWIVTSEDDDDPLTSAAHTFTIDNDTVTNSGIVGGSIWTGLGNDKITNSGKVTGDIDGDSGNDTINNNLKGVVSNIVAGSGDDTVNNAGTVSNLISLGEGADKFTGGAKGEKVLEEDGLDKYTFNGGNDTLEYRSVLDIDKADGGAGVDTLDLSQLAGHFAVVALDDFDTSKLNDGMLMFDFTPGPMPPDFVDRITNFENVIGTNDSDIIYGNKSANTIVGNDGNDVMAGSGGKDTLTGGSGFDKYVFDFKSDSGATLQTADLITDFDQSIDFITLAFMSPNFVYEDLTSFLGQDVAFTSAGQIRYTFVDTQTLIEVNTDADAIAEFAVVLTGNIHVNASNFGFEFNI